jgi:hypothetical protein
LSVPPETERFLGVHLQRDGGQSFRFETLLDAAREIAERLDVLEDGERDAVLGQGGPQPPHVAEQVLALHVQTQQPRRCGRAFGCAEASARNCGAASWGKAKGVELGTLKGSGGTAAPGVAGGCPGWSENDAAVVGL